MQYGQLCYSQVSVQTMDSTAPVSRNLIPGKMSDYEGYVHELKTLHINENKMYCAKRKLETEPHCRVRRGETYYKILLGMLVALSHCAAPGTVRCQSQCWMG